MSSNLRLGDILIEHGKITQDQLADAIAAQKIDRSKRIGEILLSRQIITEEELLVALGSRLGLEVIDLKSIEIDLDAVKMVPKNVCAKHCMLPLKKISGKVIIGVNDPLDFYAIEDMKSFIQEPTVSILCKKDDLASVINKSYAELDTRKAADKAGEIAQILTNTSAVAIEDSDSDAPVVNLVNTILLKAYTVGTSDIHIEPFETYLNIRFRVDGQLLQYMELEPGLASQLATRIKILSELDIAERRIPQDGNFKVAIGGRDVGIRVSVLPTVFGEKLVLRFLAQEAKLDNVGSFGMNDRNFASISRILGSPHGILYVTGPTGSGKTTTLYMIIETMAQKQINISTIEDPVERNLHAVSQVQVNVKAGLTFAAGLRSLLRQDPDVILIGETRDAETASIAVTAAITGHLVFSTLHTNDAVSSITRLADMGLKSYLIASAVAGIVAQRLVKKICVECKEAYETTEMERNILGADVQYLHRGAGCTVCGKTGYKGRVSVHEILEVDDEIRNMIARAAPAEELSAHLKEFDKMQTLQDNILDFVKSGVTTLEEYNKHSTGGH